VSVLRDGKPLPDIEGKDVILVDDGIAMGSTMTVSIMLCRNKNANKVIVGAPVSGESVALEIGPMVDELIVLEKPHDFHAVAQVYRNWYDVPDAEVLAILDKWSNERSKS
jgi:putative phosphoribosyl transferase